MKSRSCGDTSFYTGKVDSHVCFSLILWVVCSLQRSCESQIQHVQAMLHGPTGPGHMKLFSEACWILQSWYVRRSKLGWISLLFALSWSVKLAGECMIRFAKECMEIFSPRDSDTLLMENTGVLIRATTQEHHIRQKF